jgi:hypothetical protein
MLGCNHAMEVKLYFAVDDPSNSLDHTVRFILFLTFTNDVFQLGSRGDGER